MSARDAAIRAVEAHPSTTFMAPCESLADAVLAAAGPLLRAEVLREAADAITALPQDYECDPGRGDAAELLRRMAAEAGKVTPTAGGEITQPADTTPLVIFWDRLVMGPSGDTDDENTLVACRTENGRPAALVLDDEHRRDLGEQLLTPLGDDARELLAEIRRRGGAITSGQAHRWLRTRSSASTPRAYARTLLRRLAEYGDLVVREEQGRRTYALNHAGGEAR